MLRQVVSRLIRRSAATILTERLEGEIRIGDLNQPSHAGLFCDGREGNSRGVMISGPKIDLL